MRRDWWDRLSKIDRVSYANEVEARYRFRQKPYTLDVDAGFDPGSGQFWMKREYDVGPSSLYEAIAAQLVFKPAARPVHLLSLERALKLEIKDPSFGRPSGDGGRVKARAEWTKEDDLGAHDYDENYESGAEADPGEAVFGHSPFVPDPTRNMPNPEPISPSPKGKPRSPGQQDRASYASKEDESKGAPELEKEHIEALKRTHYASHCQMCLCERPPQMLAPPGSYIEWEEVRRRVVEAHHADLKSAGGARHAGNLILLCKLHHDNYGRKLSRAMVTAALESDTNKKTIRFGIDDKSVSKVGGRQIELVISDSGEVIKIFFTKEHADYWLSQAKTPAGDSNDGTLIFPPGGILNSVE